MTKVQPDLHEEREGYVLCCCGDHVRPSNYEALEARVEELNLLGEKVTGALIECQADNERLRALVKEQVICTCGRHHVCLRCELTKAALEASDE